jgi:hypothetical protein
MRKKERSKPIDGYEYEVTAMGAVDGKRMLVALAKIVLPALGSGFKDVSDLSKMSLQNLSINLGAAAQALVASADEATVDRIVDKLAESTEVWGPGFGEAGAPLQRNLNEHFSARYKAMAEWLGFALRVNYGDFFPDLKPKPGVEAPAAA